MSLGTINVEAGTTTATVTVRGLNVAGETTLTLTATHQAYDSENIKIPVRVELRSIELSVEPSPLVIVIGTSTELTIEVSATEDVTLTVTVDDANIIEGLAAEYLLTSGETSTTIEVRGNTIGDTTLRIAAEAAGHARETTRVSVEVLDILRIEVDTDRLSLVEDGANAEIRVSLNRIDADRGEVEVRIDLEESGLTVSSPSLTFSRSSLGRQSITVDTTTDSTYTGDRSATLTLTARGYATTMVTVDIIENTPQPIGLRVGDVRGLTDLSLVRFTSTEIGVNVGVAADLTVEAEGAVRLAGGSTLVSTSLGDLGSTQIEISGAGEGQGTVSFTVSGARKATDTVVVNVDVTRPTLVISEVSPSSINLVAQANEALTVRVSAEAGEPNDVTLTAMVLGTEVASVSPEISNIDVAADTTAMFRVAGLNAGTETLMLTAVHSDYSSATVTVTVTVSTPALVISDVSALAINLAARTTEELTVTVSAEAGEPDNVTLTATVLGEGNVASVTLAERTNVAADTTARFTVVGLDEGIATFRLTASHSGYSSASTEVTVTVYLPPVGLSVMPLPLLEFEQGATGLLMVGVSESTQATITIVSNDTDIARVPESAARFTLMGGEGNSTTIEVSGDDMIGVTTLTITAKADGYETETVIVTVEVLSRLRIEVPATFDLRERESTQISVGLTRIEVGRGTVTIDIVPVEGSGLTVSPSSLTFSDTEPQTVTVTATNDDLYTGDRNATVTFTADNYAMATVMVEITDDELQPIELLVRSSTELDLVTFETADITVSVAVAATLNVVTTGSVRLEGGSTSDRSTIDAGETQIQIEAVSIGEGTVTFTVGGGETADTAVVTVMVSKPSLVITRVPTNINLLTREATEFIVSVRAEAGVPNDVTLTATIDETSKVAEVRLEMTNVQADITMVTVRVTGLNVAGETTLTLTAEHQDYESESIEVSVDVDLRSIELSVDPSLEIVSGMSAELTITATPAVTITIISDGTGIASVPESAARFELEGGVNNSTRINVSGVSSGDTTLTIKALADGHATETATVNVEVLAPLFIAVSATTFNVTEGENIQINVNPNLIRDDVTTVTISIEATTGTTGLTVIPSSLEFTDPPTSLPVIVTATDDNDYTGDRNATLTLTATGYATETVTIRILDNDLVVTVTEPDEGSLISVDEGSDVELVINVDRPVPDRRDLDVNLRYTNITGTPETRSITVSAGSTEQSFSIPAGDDGIAAQSTRTFSVLIEPDISYAVGAPSSVAVSVLNDDLAVVSILVLSSTVNEGDPAQFEVQVSNEIATTLAVTINLTTMGDFGISPSSTDVVIVAGETTALLTVETTGDDIDEDNGSLTAAIVMNSLDPEDPIAGVRPAINANPVTVTIEDDDLPVIVSITTLEGQASTTISEADDEIMLLLTLSRDIISQDLPVNLSYMGDSGLATGAPSEVVVPASSRSQSFSIRVEDDDFVAQPDRNIDISVATGMGYTPSTNFNTVSVDVIDDDTATVTILPVSRMITGGDDAEFNVMLGLETAVNVEIGIDVKYGGVFITDRGRTTVTVLANQMSTRLTVQTMENTGTAMNSSLVATLRAVPHRALEIGTPSSASVVISALSPLSITATPTMLSLVEGGASTEINVSLNRIPAGSASVTVIINLQEEADCV